ncbi:MAG TPA: hypothetical protein VJQ58_03615, partial [Burkholderiales bacterium]|nr:hypothetical protein [Burkholderiales bacterium]
MAIITGSSNVDWSTIPYQDPSLEDKLVQFDERTGGKIDEFFADDFSVISASNTKIAVSLLSG